MIGSRQLLDAVHRKYPRDEGWCVVEELEIEPPRRIDALALNVFVNRGLFRHGFEVKIARGDWLKELKDPAKAEGHSAICHAFWLVTVPGVAQELEVPPDWGWLEGKVMGDSIALYKVRDPKLKDPVDTQDLRTKALCAIIRKVWDQDREAQVRRVRAEVDKTWRLELDRIQKNHERTLAACTKMGDDRTAHRLEVLQLFESGLGMQLERGWSFRADEAGRLCRLLLTALGHDSRQDIRNAIIKATAAASALTELESQLASLEKMKAAPQKPEGK